MKPPAKIQLLSREEVQPAYVNTLIYRPVSNDDPAVIELAESIRVHGILEPLIVTKDRVLVSGHRRLSRRRFG